MTKTDTVNQWMLDKVKDTYTTYTNRYEDLKFVGDVPSSRAEQAKLKWLPYTSLLEFVAERYHSAESYIQKLNPGKNWEHLQPGETLKVPNVLPFEVEKFTEGKVPENPAFASRKVFVDTHEHLLEVFDQDQLVCVFPITPGSKTLPAPVGTWKILGVNVWPWFRYDEGMLNYGVRTENYYNLPPGPNNLVGVLWMGLNKPGIGIHGTNNPETIGRAASHGDREAFEMIIRTHSRTLFAIAYGILQNREEAEDVVQDSLVKAWKTLWRVRDPEKFPAWLATVARHKAHDVFRKRRAVPLSEQATEPIEPEPANTSALDQKLHSALAALPELHRAALTLRYFEEMDYRTIENSLGLTNGALRGILGRALTSMRKQLRPALTPMD